MVRYCTVVRPSAATVLALIPTSLLIPDWLLSLRVLLPLTPIPASCCLTLTLRETYRADPPGADAPSERTVLRDKETKQPLCGRGREAV